MGVDACAVGMIVTRNPVHSALYLVCTLVALGVIYLILSAPVLFAVQLIVYAGAIMILFLFVIMFFMAPSALQWMRPPLKGQLVFGGLFLVVMLLLLNWGFINSGVRMSTEYEGTVDAAMADRSPEQEAMRMGNPKPLGIWLFQYHVLPFELTSILLLAALLGAMLVARDARAEGTSEVEEFASVIHQDDPEVPQ